MTFLTRARSLFGRTHKIPELLTSVVGHEAIDEYVFDDLKAQAQGFRERMETKPRVQQPDGSEVEITVAPDLFADGFNAYHNAAPNVSVHDAASVRPSHQMCRDVMGHFVEEPDFKATKAHTRGDRTTAGLAAHVATEVFIDELTNGALKEHAEQAQQMAEQEQRMADVQQQMDELREQIKTKQGSSANEQQKAELRALAQEKADARQELGQLMQAADAQPGGLTGDAYDAITRAAGAGQEMAQVWSSLPGNEPGRPQNISPDKALEMALRWRDGGAMQHIAIIAGRVTRDSKAERRRNIKGGREERIGVKLGNDLSLLVPGAQLVRLAEPALRPSFFKNFVDRSLLIYDTQSDEDAGRGPMIFVKDVSGTMAGIRHEWATGVALALIGLAQRERRACYAINYDSRVQAEWDLGKAPDLELLTDFASHFTGGGTNILAPMQRAEDIILRAPDFAKADIVLITDGKAKFDPSFTVPLRERLSERGVMVHGVSIGMPMAGNPWMDFCDSAVEVTDMSGPNEATRHLAVATI